MLDIWGQYAVNLLPIYVLQVIYIYFMDHFSTTVPMIAQHLCSLRSKVYSIIVVTFVGQVFCHNALVH